MSGLDVEVARGRAGFTLEAAFRAGAGRVVVFGPSGAGKSTLLRLIAGLDRPDWGRVAVGDVVLFDSAKGIDLPLRRRRVGLIHQDDLLFPHRDVAGNVGFGLAGWGRVEASRRLVEVAALTGIEHLLGRMPATLSGGERQRVGLARALAPRPGLLLCDEPVSALDHAARDLLLDRLVRVQAVEGIPLLYVTHSPAEAVAVGTRLIRLEAGRIVDDGPPLDVLARAPGVALDTLANRFEAVVREGAEDASETTLALVGGPDLIVPRVDRRPGSRVTVRVRSVDVLLARGPVGGLSARNALEATVVRVLGHGADAEVVVRTLGIDWVVSVVARAVESLGLSPGVPVYMIVKARSCRVADPDESRTPMDSPAP